MPSDDKQTSLERILQSQGFGSRKACRTLVRRGVVEVDGVVLKDPSAVFELEGLPLVVDSTQWNACARLVIALHKPAGVECSRSPSHHDSVLSLLPPFCAVRGVQPAGRLDQDTTGLLLLTDDGALIHQLTSPKRHITKTYVATVEDEVDDSLLEALLAGVQLHQEPAPIAAAEARRLDDKRLELVVTQGRYHQIKRMLAAAGHRCAALHRSAVGRLSLEALALTEGDWRPLEEQEIAAAFD